MAKLAGKGKPTRRDAALERYPAWKLEDAKARFSEVVRNARERGPQRVTYRGKDAVVVVSVAEFEKLLPTVEARPTLIEFLRGAELHKLDIRRSKDRGRKLEL